MISRNIYRALIRIRIEEMRLRLIDFGLCVLDEADDGWRLRAFRSVDLLTGRESLIDKMRLELARDPLRCRALQILKDWGMVDDLHGHLPQFGAKAGMSATASRA